MPFNLTSIQADFPILQRQVNGKPLVYLDNAATTQKPQVVIDAITNYYTQHNANVHRGVHALSDESTRLFEESRQVVADFFSSFPEEVIFCSNSTAALNGVAYGWADHHLQNGDLILTSIQEHHSNLVVWQEVAKRTGAQLIFIELDELGQLNLEHFQKMLHDHDKKIKLVALTQVSNALGVINPIEEMMALLKKQFGENRPRVVLDVAQSAPRIPISFPELDVDFLAFSGHKLLGPMGSGGLLVKKELLKSGEMQPWLFGGGMIQTVGAEVSDYAEEIVDRFVAGTPDVASAVGLAAAIRYMQKIGMDSILKHDQQLVQYTLEQLETFPQVNIIGPRPDFPQLKRVGSVSLIYQGVQAHDVAQVLDSEGVAVRSGHHCTMPLHQHFHWQASTRLSFEIYNSTQDIDVFIQALHKVKQVFGK